jgi:hypothetical protein
MAFENHNIRDAQWGSYFRIPSTDTQYPPITARVVETREFAGSQVTEYVVHSRFAVIVEDFKNFSNTSSVNAHSVSTGTEVLASNTDRKGYKVYNAGGQAVYLVEGTGTASASNQTLTIASGGAYTSSSPVWTGRVHVTSVGGTNSVVVTEYT